MKPTWQLINPHVIVIHSQQSVPPRRGTRPAPPDRRRLQPQRHAGLPATAQITRQLPGRLTRSGQCVTVVVVVSPEPDPPDEPPSEPDPPPELVVV